MVWKILIGIAYLLVGSGVIFIALSFRSPSIRNSTIKLIRFGEIGVIFALIGGLIFIHFFYASQMVPERIINEHLENKYVEEPSDISMSDFILKTKGIV